jgi:hypothetical protein
VSIESVKQYFVIRERSSHIPKDLIDLRYKMLNDRRFTKQRLIIEKRNEIIEEEILANGSISK